MQWWNIAENGVSSRLKQVHIVKSTLKDPPGNGAQSVDRALSLLRFVSGASADGTTLAELVQASGLNKPTVRRLLLALIRGGLVVQDSEQRSYHLGPESYVLGALAAGRHSLPDGATGAAERLAKATGDTGFVSLRRGNWSVCLHRAEGSFPIRTHALQTGMRHPLGVGAGSLAMLAALPEDEALEIIRANEAILRTQYPNFAGDALRAHLEPARERGWSLNPGLIVPGSWGMGVALHGAGQTVIGALSLAAIETRMPPGRQAELAQLLRQEALKVETQLEQTPLGQAIS